MVEVGFHIRRSDEARASVENPRVPISNRMILEFFGLDDQSAAGIQVNTETALGVPAIWAAVQFIPGTLAGLPLQLFRKRGDNRERQGGALAKILHDAPNDECSSFQWRKALFEQVLTTGRSFTFIERAPNGRIINLWLLEPTKVTVKIEGGRKLYEYKEDRKPPTTFGASEIIDIPFMLKPNGYGHHNPLTRNADVIGLAIAATKYGSKFFANGGVPPFAITGNFQSVGAMQRAAEDFHGAVKKSAKENRQALTLPEGMDIKPVGADPEKTQLVELNRFLVEQIARIYSLPPTFLQDLTHGTFSNTEQQDLHFVKHTLKRWVEQFEQELNLKLFGRSNDRSYVEMNVDGLLRGDFKTRMDGYATGVQNGILTPNEARTLENRPKAEGGDKLLIQGATVPLEQQMKLPLEQEPGNAIEE